ncbi:MULTISPECIES: hypothetical protein [Anaeromyxobacter]|uniref:hypothetical protein n=1 Tax=Anaeromyxobacter TaxID=161492 RepID=UPI001F564A05|nr:MULTISPECIES: hypothetical protein [unclassified Anaeromyxobacter]
MRLATSVPELPQAPADRPDAASRVERRHRLKFHRAGGLDQLALESGADLLALEELDQKLWIALSCPTRGLELDPRTLDLLDLDRDGRVRAPEILAAIRFCAARLRDVGLVLFGADALALDALRDDTPEGKAALGAARRLLAHVGRPEATAIRAADVADTTKVFEHTLFNGDGVVPPESAPDPGTRQTLLDIVTTMGGLADRSGKLGVDRARADAFFAEAEAFAEFWRRGEASAEVMALGDRTAAAHAAVRAVRAKVDDFFVRCGLAAMEPRSALALNRTEPEYAALAARELAAAGAEVAAFPLARVEPGRALPLSGGVNPAWAAAIAALQRDAVVPVHGPGKDALTLEEWTDLVARFSPYEAWLATKTGARVEALGIARVRELLAAGRAPVQALLAEDEAHAAEASAIADVVRLVHYCRDLGTLLKNFVSFADFYDPLRPAVFQAGTLFLDARSCELCIRVDDPGAHASIASLSRMYLAYCECRRPGGEAMKIVACFTQGDSDYLMVGRNGVFYDRQGRDWDATIVKIVENPISIRQAFWAPYKKALRFVEEQVARFAHAKQKAADDHVQSTATHVTDAAIGEKAPPPPPPVDVGKMVGIIAALGVGIGALGTLLGGFVTGFMDLKPWWAKVIAVAAMVLVVSGPSVLISWLKLRHRTLGPILDANGWAVNGRVRINLPLGTALTDRAVLPAGARRTLDDPYADDTAKRRRRLLWLAAAAAALALGAARYLGHWPFGPPFWRG